MTRARIFLRCLGALLLLTAVTWLVELAALVVLWRGQTLAPYAFFPNQAYDFLAKIRWFAGPLADWAPALPDRFAGLAAAEKLEALAPLLPATLVTAIVVGIVGAALVALVSRSAGSLRRDLVFWAAVGVVVHLAASLPAFNLDEGVRIGRLAFRARSLVVDGMMLATLVSLVALAIAWLVAPLFERSRAVAVAGALAMIVAAGVAATVPVRPPVTAKAVEPAGAAGTARNNVVLISLDSLRADHLGAWGYKRDTSPNLDKLARESIRFSNAISTSSWTLPTHLTMFTGLSQVAHGVVVDTNVLPRSIRTLGEIFHDAGYATAGFVSGPYVSGHYGYDRGMDTYIDLSAQWGKSAEARAAILSPEINAKGLAWLDQTRDQPFFLFLHYFDIHYDFVPPPPYDTMFDPDYTGTMDGRMFIERDDVHPKMPARDLEHILALYDGEIRFTDHHVGIVLDHLRSKGLLDSTVVMVVSDHGDEFFEHGNKGHHRTVYDEVLRIPMLLRLPGGEQGGRTIDRQTSLIDVFPTVLDAAGLSPGSGAEGESLAAWARGTQSSREEIYSDFYDKRGFNLQVARRTAGQKTIQHFNRITHPKRGPLEDYDLAKDPAEKTNRAPSGVPAVATGVEAMTRWLDDQWRTHRDFEAASGGSASIHIDDETMQRLKSLGYVGE